MKQEDKELILKDLSARLPYEIIVQQSAQYPENHFMYSVVDKWKTEPHDFKIIGVEGTNTLITDKRKEEKSYTKGIVSSPITICIYNNFTKQITKPYLRPMSSMTAEEKRKYYSIIGGKKPYDCDYSAYPTEYKFIYEWDIKNYLDFVNTYHFDYRGLIPKGLAIEVTKENNPYEEINM